MKGLSEKDRDSMAHILDIADRAIFSWEPQCTNFVSPRIYGLCLQMFGSVKHRVHMVGWGGHDQAERHRVCFARGDLPVLNPSTDIPLAVLSISGKFQYDEALHGDFLGAVLGTGITRSKIGDIFVSDSGAQAVCVPDITDYIQSSLTKVRTVPVKVEVLGISELRPTPVRTKEFTAVEASVRLDAVVSAGFKISRSKAALLILSRKVRHNWQNDNKPSDTVRAGDFLSISGMGRINLKESAETRKGKYRLTFLEFK